MLNNRDATRASVASEPRDRSEPAERRARRVQGSPRGEAPRLKTMRFMTIPLVLAASLAAARWPRPRRRNTGRTTTGSSRRASPPPRRGRRARSISASTCSRRPGLMPMPERTPLRPVVFDEVAHADYTVSKVYFESLPGFFVTGNLYRPIGAGPFPADPVAARPLDLRAAREHGDQLRPGTRDRPRAPGLRRLHP